MTLLGDTLTLTKKSKKNKKSKDKIVTKKSKSKKHSKVHKRNKKDSCDRVYTNKFRITTEVALTGTKKNPLKSKMTGFFVKFSFKDDDKVKKIEQEPFGNKSKVKK